jgi:cobalt-zinc-cadmium efflux system protein
MERARVARRPADALRSYGYHRFQVIAACTNGISLSATVAWIVGKQLPKVIRRVTISDGVEITQATSRSTA